MNVLFTILTVLVLIASVLITLIVLLQNGKGGGLASNFTAGNQTFGVRQTADILERITWGLVIFIFVVSIATSFSYGSKKGTFSESAPEMEQQVVEETPDFSGAAEEVEIENPEVASETETEATPEN